MKPKDEAWWEFMDRADESGVSPTTQERRDNEVWNCKYCGENDTPQCHKCIRNDGVTYEEWI